MILTDILLCFIIAELAIIAVFLSPTSDPMIEEMMNMARGQIATQKARKKVRTKK